VAAQVFGNARAAYVPGGGLPTIALAARYAGSRPVSQTGFVEAPDAPAQTELRLTVTGVVPGLEALSFRSSLNYAFADRGPYVIGPLSTPTETFTRPELAPENQLTLGFGLQYEMR